MRSSTSIKAPAFDDQRGFTLIEILIAIVVLAVGLLALAGLQLQTLRYSHSASMRNIATTQAASLTDKVLGNRLALLAGKYNNKTGASTAACFTAAGCTSDQMASLDLQMWNQSNATALPDGVGIICIDSTPNDGTSASPACDDVANAPYVIKIWWSDDRSTETSTKKNTARFVTSLQP